MTKNQKGISNKILDAELHYAVILIDQQNYGMAKDIINSIRDRVKSYLLKKEVPDKPKTTDR